MVCILNLKKTNSCFDIIGEYANEVILKHLLKKSRGNQFAKSSWIALNLTDLFIIWVVWECS